jgi:glutamate-1-semialdehyde aminotransferase
LSSVSRENEAAFIVDETSTGLSTGRGYFASKADADFVVFGKKT